MKVQNEKNGSLQSGKKSNISGTDEFSEPIYIRPTEPEPKPLPNDEPPVEDINAPLGARGTAEVVVTTSFGMLAEAVKMPLTKEERERLVDAMEPVLLKYGVDDLPPEYVLAAVTLDVGYPRYRKFRELKKEKQVQNDYSEHREERDGEERQSTKDIFQNP